MTELSLIYARSENFCIGRDGKLPWFLPAESAFFDRTTRGHAVIMGRRTYEDHQSRLEDRLNIVLSRDRQFQPVPSILVATSLDAALLLVGDVEVAFVIGGAGLFQEALPRVTRVYETIISAIVDGDVFVPAFDFTTWTSTMLIDHPVDRRHPFAFRVFLHQRPTAGSS